MAARAPWRRFRPLQASLQAVMMKRTYLLLLLAVAVTPCFAGTCHVVTATGSGANSGVDWNNALKGLPATLVRGDSYYLADGTYGSYSFTTTGTTATFIKKAVAADHCTDTGWNASTMGSTQAVFRGTPTAWNSTSSSAGNYTVDGITGDGETGSSYGIKFVNTATCGSSNGCGYKTLVLDNSVPNVTFAHVEIQGGGLGAGNDGTEHLIWMQGTGTLLDHIFAHDSECDFMQTYGPGNFTVQYSHFYKNGNGGGSPHCQVMWANGTSNITWKFNTIHDVGGSALWTFATGSCLSPCVNDNISIYGNSIWLSSPPSSGSSFAGIGDGVFACINSGVVCTNVRFYNNTVANMLAYNGQAMNTGNYLQNPGGSFTSENNIYYNNNGNSGTYGFTPVIDHNSYLGAGGGDTRCGTACVTNSSASDPFVDSANGNFELTSDVSTVNNWATLASPFNVDPLGTVRTTDRGAYQYGSVSSGGTGTPPAPPSGLAAVVQ